MSAVVTASVRYQPQRCAATRWSLPWALLGLLGGCGEVAPRAALSPAPAAAPSPALIQAPLGRDKLYVIRAAAEETSAATLGQLGQRRSSSLGVRQYAAGLAAKHKKMRQELIDLAKRRGSFVPMTMSHGGETFRRTLQQRPASQFDRDYLTLQVQMQQDVAAELLRVSGCARDAELRQWARGAATQWQLDEASARSLQQSIAAADAAAPAAEL